ncbi:hypothetical protein [Nocardia carnea]|uniref:hypothetical protein n=1 Tax=Nocardia carnea TaxID=37328 RepID=UPI00245774E7|nr:hypothetical protein [Nocardia carnea]
MYSSPGESGGAGRVPVDRVATLDRLRERMAAVPSRIGTAGTTRTVADQVIAVPGPIGELLPGGGLPRGRVVGCPRGALVCALLAAATDAGLHAAVLGGLRASRINMGAAAEMGADIGRIALVDAGDRAAEVVGVLADGIPVIILDDPSVRLRPQQEEALRGRLRDKETVLITTNELGVRQPYLDIEATHIADHGLGQGRGRLSGFDVDVRVSRQGRLFRRGRVSLVGHPGAGTQWRHPKPVSQHGTGPGLAITG